MYQISHHGAVHGVDGSLHELTWRLEKQEIHRFWIDCGGWVRKSASGSENEPNVPQPLPEAIFVTHAHFDHIGRVPQALVAGFKGQIYASKATCELIPALIEENLRLEWTRNRRLITKVLKLVETLLRPVSQKQWFRPIDDFPELRVRFHPAGHILGSSWIEFEGPCIRKSNGKYLPTAQENVVFSGDLGRSQTALLPAPSGPVKADLLVLESTYGGKSHPSPGQRKKELLKTLVHALENEGSILVPAFSLGRAQEMLAELDQLKRSDRRLKDLEIILDSPIALKLTELHRKLQYAWSEEARKRWQSGARPLDPENFTPIESHQDHLRTVRYLAQTGRPALVLASSGMCEGGRIVNYLEKMLPDPRHDLVFLGYQAKGTLGAAIQNASKKKSVRSRRVIINKKNIEIRAQVTTISGYSAHADHQGLIKFTEKLQNLPREIRLVHGDQRAKNALRRSLKDKGFRAFCPK